MADLQNQRYILQRELGVGAMGSVWLATDSLLDRPVAIKYLKAPENTTHKEFFLSEARTLASLNHPNITLIYDAVFDDQNNQFYLVMEYVAGQSLASLIEGWSGPLPLHVTLDVAVGVLEALQYAHDKEIVHRDIKPANVIIQKEGIKLTDFGLAGLVSILADQGSYMVGTPAYMSPEQIEGLPSDGRSDLYALGIMLFEMLSGGYKPFDQYTLTTDLFEAHVKKPPPSVRSITPETPLAIERVVGRLLAKDPDERYPSANVVIDVLNSIRARQQFSQLHLNLLDLEIKPVVGREAELKKLADIWAESQKFARPRLVVVRGEMGIGKTSLVAEFLGHHVIDAGAVALMGRCDQSGMPYTPFSEMLAAIISRGLSKAVTGDQVDLLLSHIPDLARLLDIPEPAPSKNKPPPDSAADSEADSQRVRWRFFNVVLHILADLGPTVLFFEDADYLDEASVALTQFLVRRGQLPLLIIAACQGQTVAQDWLRAFSADETMSVDLPPLPKTAIAAKLIDTIGGPVDEGLVSFIRQRSRGNPLQIEETTRQLLDSKTLERDEDGQWHYIAPVKADKDDLAGGLAVRRLEALSILSRRALALAALIEPTPEFDFDIWLMLLGGKSQMELAEKTRDEALTNRLLRQVDDNRFSFRPPSVVKKLVDELQPAERPKLHHRLAEILHQKQKDPLLVAHHYEEAGATTEAAHYLEEMGARAAVGQALQAAIVYYKRAVMLVESRSAYKTLGRLYRQERKWINSLQALQNALELAEEAEDVADQAEILNELSFTLWLYDDYEEAYEPAAAVLDLPEVDTRQKATAYAHLAMITWLTGRLAEAEAWCKEAITLLTQLQDEAGIAEIQHRLGLVHLSQGQLAAAEADFQQSLATRQRLPESWRQGYALTGLGQIATEQGHFERALFFFNTARQHFEKADHSEGRMTVYKHYGRLLLAQQRPAEALPWLTKSLHLALKIGKHRAYGLSDIYRLIALAGLMRGELKLAHSAATDALKLVEAVGNWEYVALSRLALAQIYAAQAETEQAEAAYQAVLEIFEEIGSQSGHVQAVWQYAQFLGQQNRTAEAARLEAEARDEAARLGIYLR